VVHHFSQKLISHL
jgi:glycyl-tRNA synthetase